MRLSYKTVCSNNSAQVQHHSDPEEGVCGRLSVLDPLLPHRTGSDDGMEQAPRWRKPQQLRRHRLRIHRGHEDGLHGVLQLLRLGGGAAVRHDRPVRRDLPGDPAAA